MAFQNSALVRDNSTLANFKSWGSTISAFFTTAGWTQSSDTGQVNWSTIGSVPAVNTYVYEIWKPNDGLTNFFLKVEYGTNSASTNTGPSMRISSSTATNGAGTLSGTVSSLVLMPGTVTTVTSTVTQFQCYFCGAAGRIAVMLWRDDTTNLGPQFFCVERSQNASGTYTSTYWTTLIVTNSTNQNCYQQSILFSGGAGLIYGSFAGGGGTSAGWVSFMAAVSAATTNLFNGSTALSPVFPGVGYFDNPMLMAACGATGDFTEGSTYIISAANMPYGASKTYLAAKNPPISRCGQTAQANTALLMQYD